MRLQDYTWAEDGTSVDVIVHVTGAGGGGATLIATGGNPGLLDAGYPLLETAYSLKDVTDASVLAARAAAIAKAHSEPLVLVDLTAEWDGNGEVGDEARVHIKDPNFPLGVDDYKRITSMEVQPLTSTARETVRVTLGPRLP